MDTPRQATRGDLVRSLAQHGIPFDDVKSCTVVIDPWDETGDSPLVLEVDRYLTDGSGSRFAVRLPSGEYVAATERIMVGRLYAFEVEPRDESVDVTPMGSAWPRRIPGAPVDTP